MLKSYNKQKQLKDKIIEWQEYVPKPDIKWDIKQNRPKMKCKFYINGTDFNWNYQYKFSSISLFVEPFHLIHDLFGDIKSSPILMIAIKYKLLKPITPISFLEANFNSNISFYVDNPGRVTSNTSYIAMYNIIRHDSLSNTETEIAQIFGVGVNTVNKSIKPKTTSKSNKIEQCIKREKSLILKTAKYIATIIEKTGNNVIYSKQFKIEHSNLDRNVHVKQSIYLRNIENCLYQYDNEFFKGYWKIEEITCNHKKKLKLDATHKIYKSSSGKVIILETKLMNNNTKKSVIGIITQYDTICANFQCILSQTNKSQL